MSLQLSSSSTDNAAQNADTIGDSQGKEIDVGRSLVDSSDSPFKVIRKRSSSLPDLSCSELKRFEEVFLQRTNSEKKSGDRSRAASECEQQPEKGGELGKSPQSPAIYRVSRRHSRSLNQFEMIDLFMLKSNVP